jgi:hypothetical protein
VSPGTGHGVIPVGYPPVSTHAATAPWASDPGNPERFPILARESTPLPSPGCRASRSVALSRKRPTRVIWFAAANESLGRARDSLQTHLDGRRYRSRTRRFGTSPPDDGPEYYGTAFCRSVVGSLAPRPVAMRCLSCTCQPIGRTQMRYSGAPGPRCRVALHGWSCRQRRNNRRSVARRPSPPSRAMVGRIAKEE